MSQFPFGFASRVNLPALLGAGALAAGLAAGADPAAVPAGSSPALSLPEAQQMAFERNWDLLAAASDVDAALAQKIIAREFPNPSLSISTAKISADSAHGSSTALGNGLWDRSYDTIFAVNQLFEIGGKRRSRQRSAQAGWDGARARLLDARRVLGAAVAKAYVTAMQAQENASVLLASAATLRKEAEIAATRLKAGDISASDKSQIEITAERFELDAQAAKAAAAQARVALEVLLGISKPDGQSILSDNLERLCADSSSSTNATNLDLRPDVVAAAAALRKAEADLALQKAMRVPDPTVLGQYEHEPPDQPNTLGLGVSFPLPLWNRNRGNIRAAEAARDSARLALEKTRAQAAADIATAQLAFDEALKRWQNYRDEIRAKSQQIRETVAYAYSKGGASLLDLLSAERNDNDVRLAAVQAASDAATAAEALRAATQVIEPDSLRK